MDSISSPNPKLSPIGKLSESEKQEVLRARVMDIAREIFATKGFHWVTFEKLEVATGIGTKEIRNMFRSVEELYWEVYGEEMHLFYGQLFLEIQGKETWLETLRTMFYFTLQYFFQKSLARKIVFPFGVSIPIHEDTFAAFRKRARTYELPVKQYLENIFDQQLFPGHSAVFIDIIFDFLGGLMVKMDEGADFDSLKKEVDFFLNLIM